MAKKFSGLGRGLDALMGDISFENGNLASSTPAVQGVAEEIEPQPRHLVAVREVPLTLIDVNPFQPRETFSEEELRDLSDSIARIGIIQPITLRATGERYQIISGERRFRASRMAGLATIPAYVREADDQGMIEMALVENIQRSDLNAIEIALSFQRLLDECHISQEELSPRVGKSRATISNYMRLLKLPAEIQFNIRSKALSMGHARTLLGLEDQELQLMLMHRILEEGLSVRKCEELVRELSQGANPEQVTETDAGDSEELETPEEAPTSPLRYVEEMETALQHRLGWGVKVNGNAKGSGKIVITFRTEGEREELMRKLLQQE